MGSGNWEAIETRQSVVQLTNFSAHHLTFGRGGPHSRYFYPGIIDRPFYPANITVMEQPQRYVAFAGSGIVAEGEVGEVLPAIKRRFDRSPSESARRC